LEYMTFNENQDKGMLKESALGLKNDENREVREEAMRALRRLSSEK
jgi:hypothetical protein